MKILVVGAGLSGSTLARELYDSGYSVHIIDKESCIGGLSITRVDKNGLKYEPYGARTLHTTNERVISFVQRFGEFNGYSHRKGVLINGCLFPFPLNRNALSQFKEEPTILEELRTRPEKVDKTNFETACISIFGKTLYSFFIENYSRKMWDKEPRELTAEWAPKRLELRECEDDRLFGDQWQGLPSEGYSVWMERMVEGIPTILDTAEYDEEQYDLIFNSAPIDQTLEYCYGQLEYRSVKFRYQNNEQWEKELYGTLNLPQHDRYFRKCNFKVLHKQNSEHALIQYQEATDPDSKNLPMYPVNTVANNRKFDQYLRAACKRKKVCPIGRLGLFKYLDMDKAIEAAFLMTEFVGEFLFLTPAQRYERIQSIRMQF